jgi:two-component system OmpR family response regulator
VKVLIIEDNTAIVTSLRQALRNLYIVDAAHTGADGIHAAEGTPYDAIILDLLLPDKSGLAVCQELRRRGVTTPIMVLTGEDEIEQKVALLDAGAEDYLTKPFRLEEFKARLRVQVRRSLKRGLSSLLCVGDLTLDLATRQVHRQEIRIELRRKEYALLEYLMHNAGKAVTRAMILDHVWDTSADNMWTNAVDVHIKYLRDKIDRPFDSGPLIATMHGIGYKLEATQPDAYTAAEA